jgi:hypothetical protein
MVSVPLRESAQEHGVGDVALQDVLFRSGWGHGGKAVLLRDEGGDLLVVDGVEGARHLAEGQAVQLLLADDPQPRWQVTPELRLEGDYLPDEDLLELGVEAQLDLDRDAGSEL